MLKLLWPYCEVTYKMCTHYLSFTYHLSAQYSVLHISWNIYAKQLNYETYKATYRKNNLSIRSLYRMRTGTKKTVTFHFTCILYFSSTVGCVHENIPSIHLHSDGE